MAKSRLQQETSRFLSDHFGTYIIQENIRPDWLITKTGGRLELDFFIEELGIAIEVQGEQHYTYTPFFHENQEGFEKRLYWDRLKKEICNERGIYLIEIASENDFHQLREAIREKEGLRDVLRLAEWFNAPTQRLPNLQIVAQEQPAILKNLRREAAIKTQQIIDATDLTEEDKFNALLEIANYRIAEIGRALSFCKFKKGRRKKLERSLDCQINRREKLLRKIEHAKAYRKAQEKRHEVAQTGLLCV